MDTAVTEIGDEIVRNRLGRDISCLRGIDIGLGEMDTADSHIAIPFTQSRADPYGLCGFLLLHFLSPFVINSITKNIY